MTSTTNYFDFLIIGVSPVFTIISLILGIILLIVGLVLKGKAGKKGTVGWVCIGVGALSVISNVIQLIMRFV